MLGLFNPIQVEAREGVIGRISLKSKAAILMDAASGAVLYEKDAHSQYYPASITKVPTALYALEKGNLDMAALVTGDQDSLGWVSAAKKKKSGYSLPPYWLEPGGTHASIKVGEKVPMQDLLYGLMLVSGNDCANLIAKHVGGDISLFSEKLTEYAKNELGCKATNFVNPHGLHHPDHKTTAYDMALIARRALQHPMFRSIVASKEYQRRPTNKATTGSFRQGNKLLKPGKYRYSKAIGVKTGYHEKAQHTFIAAAEDNGRTLIAVLLYCDEKNGTFEDAKKLLEAGFQQKLVTKVFFPKGKQQFTRALEGYRGPVGTYTKKDVAISYYGDEPKVRCLLSWKTLEENVEEGMLIGNLEIISINDDGSEGNSLETIELYAQEETSSSWTDSVLERISLPSKTMARECLALGCVSLLMGTLVRELRKKKE